MAGLDDAQVDWGADFVDDEEESLQEEFGRAIDETIAQRFGEGGFGAEEEDTEVGGHYCLCIEMPLQWIQTTPFWQCNDLAFG